jgi:hypothetical protein
MIVFMGSGCSLNKHSVVDGFINAIGFMNLRARIMQTELCL